MKPKEPFATALNSPPEYMSSAAVNTAPSAIATNARAAQTRLNNTFFSLQAFS